jgi:hypothetical protein
MARGCGEAEDCKPGDIGRAAICTSQIAPDHDAGSMTPLRLNIQLVNGRRAELTLSDEEQLGRVLKLLEQPL